MAQEIADSKLIDTWSSGGLKVEPDVSKILEGWQFGEQPPHEYMNWLQNTFGSKLNHILKNGVAEWNNKTEYLAGSSVQYSGSIWLCKTTNTNSEPTELNANWEKVAINKDLTVTVDTLADLKNISYPANTVWTSGYHAKNDGAFGSHIFRLKGVKTTETDNSGTVIIATIGGVDYVYELQYDGAVNVKWFGARGDGVTDDIDAIQACILFLGAWPSNPVGGIVFFPKGKYVISSPIVLNMNVTIQGEGNQYTTMIKASDSFIGSAIIISVNNSSTYVSAGINILNIGVFTNNKDCHGLLLYSLHSNSKLSNIFITGVADTKSAIYITGNPLASYPRISESFILENIIAWHNNATATAPTIYLDACHEATLINVKSFGCMANVKAPSCPIHINDSRGITLINCTSAFTSGNGLKVTATTRYSSGVRSYGHSFEGIDGTVCSIVGASGAMYVKGLDIVGSRMENVPTSTLFAELVFTQYSRIESDLRTVSISTGSADNIVKVHDESAFIDTSGQPNQVEFTGNYRRSYIVTSGTLSRTFDANASTLEGISDVLYTLIYDLSKKGIVKL